MLSKSHKNGHSQKTAPSSQRLHIRDPDRPGLRGQQLCTSSQSPPGHTGGKCSLLVTSAKHPQTPRGNCGSRRQFSGTRQTIPAASRAGCKRTSSLLTVITSVSAMRRQHTHVRELKEHTKGCAQLRLGHAKLSYSHAFLLAVPCSTSKVRCTRLDARAQGLMHHLGSALEGQRVSTNQQHT